MKFLIDENIPLILAKNIIKKYPNSKSILDTNLRGKSDSLLYKIAKKENFIILTFDTDFLDIITYPLENTSGRIILRYKNLKISEITDKTLKNLQALEKRDIEESLVIISNKKIRIRRFSSD